MTPMDETLKATMVAMVCEFCHDRGMTAKEISALFRKAHTTGWYRIKGYETAPASQAAHRAE